MCRTNKLLFVWVNHGMLLHSIANAYTHSGYLSPHFPQCLLWNIVTTTSINENVNIWLCCQVDLCYIRLTIIAFSLAKCYTSQNRIMTMNATKTYSCSSTVPWQRCLAVDILVQGPRLLNAKNYRIQLEMLSKRFPHKCRNDNFTRRFNRWEYTKTDE